MDLDQVLRDVGEYGKYQKLLLWFVLLPAHLPFGTHYYSQLFMSLTPGHWCHGASAVNDDFGGANTTARPLTLWSRGQENPSTRTLAECTLSPNWTALISTHLGKPELQNESGKPSACAYGYDYDRTELHDEDSIVTMWDLVCHRDWLPTLALTLFCLGALVGQCLYFFVMSRYGKRLAFFLFLATQCLSGVVTALAPDFVVFVALRFMVGLSVPGVAASPSALAQELVGPNYRTCIGFLSHSARSLGIIFLSGMVFLVRDWSHIALVTTLPFLAFFLYWWVFPESPNWLRSKGRYEEVGRLLEVIAQANGRELPPDYIINLKRRFRVEGALRDERRQNQSEHKYTLWDLFRKTNMRKKTTAVVFIWFTTSTACVGLTHYSFEMDGELYLNFVLSAGAQVVAAVVVVAAVERCGRRCSFCLSSALGGALTFTIATTQSGTTSRLTLFVVAKLSVSSSSVVLPLWTGELLPSVVRSMGLQLMDVISLVGPVALPFLLNQGRYDPSFPLLTLGILQVAGAVAAALFLPETIHQKSLQTLEDGEQFGKHWTWRDCFRIGPPKQETKNGILKNRGPQPQSPILSLLRRQDSLRRASSDGDPEPTDALPESPPDHGPLVETVRVTVV